ncbi:MAG: amino acid carrier protein [Magnetococcus sp. WYHC-3]
MLSSLAGFIWNPLLSLIYIELGLLFLAVTGMLALRRTMPHFLRHHPFSHASGDNTRNIGHGEGFFAALATSIGVGNLAGVGTALHLGGPGALFWMWVSALLGMSFRMASTYMALRYQPADSHDLAFGTPMAYLQRAGRGFWRFLPTAFAGLIVANGLVAANMIQANSVAHAMEEDLGLSHGIVAVLLAGLVGLVIIGGLKNILKVSAWIAPWMAVTYVILAVVILALEPARCLAALAEVFRHALEPYSAAGGLAGYTVLESLQYGISRGVFSHGSGIGMAPFLHAANRDHPIHGSMMAAMIPVVDTLVVCTATGLVLLSSGLWIEHTGAYLTVTAFQQGLGMTGRVIVTIFLIVFAFTTMINWSYLSERCYLYLGGRNTTAFRWVFVAVAFAGPFLPVASVWSLGDLLIAGLLLVHLLPLTGLLLRHARRLRNDLA